MSEALVLARVLQVHQAEHMNGWVGVVSMMGDDVSWLEEGRWHSVEWDDGSTWSWIVEDGHGRSRPSAPDGAPRGRSGLAPDARALCDRFDSAVEDVLAERLAEGERPAGQVERDVLATVSRAIRPGWSPRVVDDLLAPIRAHVRAGLEPADARGLWRDVMMPDLARMRRQYAVDVTTTVGVAASVELFDRTLLIDGTSVDQLRRVTAPLLGSDENEPMALLAATCSVLLDVGLESVVALVAEQARDRAAVALDAGRSATSMDDHLNSLYGAATHNFTALVLARFLATYGASADRERWTRIWRQLDERMVRLVFPFAMQALDLNSGAQWARHREIVRRAALEGPEARDGALHTLVDVNWFYPRSMRDRLSP